MATSLIQNKGGTFTGSTGSKTCVMSFHNDTAGSDLIIAYARVTSVTAAHSTMPPDPTLTISSPGLTFVPLTPAKCYETPYIAGAGSYGVSWIFPFAVYDSPVISHSAVLTASVSIGGGFTVLGNLGLLEFSCNPSAADITLGPVTQNNTVGTGTYVVSAGSITPPAGELVFAFASVLGGDPLAIGGSGWVSEPALNYGQYYLNAPGTVLSTTFANQSNAFSVLAVSFSSAPTVISCTPNTGFMEGGTPCSLTVTNAASNATVTFGGLPATSIIVSGSSINCLTPAHAVGEVDIVVTNPDTSLSGTLTDGFTYVSPTLIVSAETGQSAFDGGSFVLSTTLIKRVWSSQEDQSPWEHYVDLGITCAGAWAIICAGGCVASPSRGTGPSTVRVYPMDIPAGAYTSTCTITSGSASVQVSIPLAIGYGSSTADRLSQNLSKP